MINLMKVREFFSFNRAKRAGVFFSLLLVLIGSLLLVSRSYALSQVVLTGSAFSDTDAEDTHKSSQWVITDASGGGNTVYDSGTDAANLTTITVDGAYFSLGTTYYWKVRYQDNHDVWSDYSDESSFTYGASPTPTPTPAETVTTTDTSTATSTPNPSPTATPDCMFGWSVLYGRPFCGDAMVADIYLEDTKPDCDGKLDLTYYVYDAYTAVMTSGVLDKRYSMDVHDFYYSIDGGASYKRFISDYDFTANYSWEKKPVDSGYNYVDYLVVRASVTIPDEAKRSSKFRALVHVYPKSTVGNGLNWGRSFIPVSQFTGIAMTSFDATAFTTTSDQSQCVVGIAPTVTPEAILQCKYDFVSPQDGDAWPVNSSQQISWVSRDADDSPDNKASLYLLTNRDQQKTSIAMMQQDEGVITYQPNFEDSVTSGKFLLDTFNKDGKKISSCISSVVGFKYPSEPEGPITAASIVMVLGSVFALAASYVVSLVSSIPTFSRVFASVAGSLFAPPIWPTRKGKWGVVYDSISKRPIVGAIIRVFSEPDGKLRDSRRTNENGEFGFIIPIGSYSITVSKQGYHFPSHIITGSSDSQYHNVYKGGELDVHPTEGGRAPLNINIPLDQTKANVLDLSVVSALHFISRVSSVVRLPLLVLGTIFATYLATTQGRWFDFAILAFYVALWAMEIFHLMKKRTYGAVSDDSGQPVSLVMVRIVDKANRLKGTVLTGEDGKFMVPLGQGEYRFSASKAGFSSVRSDFVQINKVSDVGKVNLELKKLVNHDQYPEQDHSRL